MTDMTDRNALFQAIDSSPGAAYINRSHGRSSSLNIFQRNAQELIEATRHVRDPDQGLQLMAVANREAGQQAHREINRLVHNFVAGSMSLIEHTRQFIREHYADTALEGAYEDRVKANFASKPVAKFIQDLRNYMVHKGLPSSQMFLAFDSAGGAGARGELTTGVRYQTGVLLEWDGWTAPAKVYIGAAGEYLDVHIFAESYLEKVLLFHTWLESELRQYHAADLAQLQAMQEDYARLSAQSTQPEPSSELKVAEIVSPTSDEPSIAPPFEFPAAVAAAVDEAANTILARIRRLDLKGPTTDPFPSERPVGVTLTPDTMRETPILRGNDSEGRPVVAFLTSGTETFGLDLEVYAEVQPLAEKILELAWAKPALSRKFIEEIALHWFRSSFRATSQQVSFSGTLSAASRDMVRPLDMWAPIAFLEVAELR